MRKSTLLTTAALMLSLSVFSSALPWINEIHYDNSGSDVGEGVEIAGSAGMDLTGYEIVLYNGGNSAEYGTTVLSGVIDDEGAGYGALWFPISGIQNGGPDGIALVDAFDNVIEVLAYEGSMTAASGVAAGRTFPDIGVAETSSTAIGLSLQRTGTGFDGFHFQWIGPDSSSYGDLNTGQSIGAPGASVSFDALSSMANEGNSGMSMVAISVSISQAPHPDSAGVRVLISDDMNGSADSADYHFEDSILLFTNAGALTQSVMVSIMGDADFEADETVNLSLSVLSGDAIAGGTAHTLTITNDDTLAVVCSEVFINEMHYDNSGADIDEGFEVAGPAGTDLAGWSIVLYNGNNGAEYGTLILSGVITDQVNGYGAIWFDRTGLQNGSPDGVALVNGAVVAQFLSYEGSMTATDGPAAGMTSVDVGVAQGPGTSDMTIQAGGDGNCHEDFQVWNGPMHESRGWLNDGQSINGVPVCAAPGGLEAMNVRDKRAFLSWDCTMGGTDYMIRGWAVGSTDTTWINITGCGSPYRMSPLTTSTMYVWQVKSICDAVSGNESAWSATDTFTTTCSAPDSAMTMNITSTSADFSWAMVDGATGYEVRGKKVSGGPWVMFPATTSTSLSSGAILSASTDYFWQVRSVCANGSTSGYGERVPFTTAASKTSIWQTSADFGIYAWPNPASDLITIQLSGTSSESNLVQLTDLSGRVVFAARTQPEDQIQINTSDFATGIYNLSVSSADRKAQLKMVIAR